MFIKQARPLHPVALARRARSSLRTFVQTLYLVPPQIAISAFKSFRDEVVITFDEHHSVIVGRNGHGKSVS